MVLLHKAHMWYHLLDTYSLNKPATQSPVTVSSLISGEANIYQQEALTRKSQTGVFEAAIILT